MFGIVNFKLQLKIKGGSGIVNKGTLCTCNTRFLYGGTAMSQVSYDKLWKILEEKQMMKTELIKNAGISTNAMAKLGKNEDVRVNILVKLCDYFDCTLNDIVEILPDESK